MTDLKISKGKRFGSMLLDHFIMCMLMFVIILPFQIIAVTKISFPDELSEFPPLFPYLVIAGMTLYLCKDCINGRSLAKRMTKLQVVNHRTGIAANPLRCMVRNIFIAIWPIELIVALINPERRIGDHVAGTRLIPFDPSIPQPKLKIGELALTLIITFGVMAASLALMPKWTIVKNNATPVESSYNLKESRELENIYIQSMSAYLTPEAKVYDQVKNDTMHLKYVSIVFKLNNDFEVGSKYFNDLKDATTQLLFSMYPERTIVGLLKYRYNGDGRFHSMVVNLDWR